MHQLSQRELFRLTGSHDTEEQVTSLKRLGIPYHERRIAGGGMLIGLNVYNTEVQKIITDIQWLVISDCSTS